MAETDANPSEHNQLYSDDRQDMSEKIQTGSKRAPFGEEEKIPVDGPERQHGHPSDDEKIPVEKTHGGIEIPVINDVERADKTDLSFAAILKGTAANPLNTFEKKAALINVELDKFGLGKYQICIWFLCGFGYFLDLAWSQGVGLIASAIYQEVSSRKPVIERMLISCSDGSPRFPHRRYLRHCERWTCCWCARIWTRC